jgi:TRAP-type C4-dicarboxylate transport system permease small subunit
MRAVVRVYEFLLFGFAWIAGFLLVAMMTTIVIDVVLRNLGFQGSAHLFTFTEYALLLIPCLGAPWLVRERGHVFVEIVLVQLSRDMRRVATQGIAIVCIVICLVIAWYGFEVALNNFRLADKDVRSFDAPRWALVVWIPVSFLMMAIEFGRFFLRHENFLGYMTGPAGDSRD